MKQPWTCPKCGTKMKASGKGGHGATCGKDQEMFWAHVRKTEACWLYEGTISFEGYGYVNRGSGPRRRQYQAHRYAWILLRGEIPDDKCLLHKCDVRNCVNPEHLYLGDRKDNARDCIERGRRNSRYTPVDKLLFPELSQRGKMSKRRDAAGGDSK